MRRFCLVAAVPCVLLAVACWESDDSLDQPLVQADAGADAANDVLETEASADAASEGGVEPTCAVEQCQYGPLSPWREPIADYIDLAEETLGINPRTVNRALDDLIVFEDHLYFGYGDATQNMGRHTPIQIRYFASPYDEQPTVDFAQTDEEEIALFRRFGDMLYIPGVDATEDAFLGNVFTRPAGGKWTKNRAVPGGVHVHDVAEFQGDLYACGSGAPDLEAWNTQQVRSILWKSTDQGASWTVVAEVPNEEKGDRRWVNLAPFDDRLYLFGYRTNIQGTIVAVLVDEWDGTTLTESTAAPGYFVEGTERFDADTAIIRAVDADEQPLHYDVLKLQSGQSASVIEPLADKAVLDIDIIEPGSALFMTVDGAEYTYPAPETPPTVRIYHTRDLSQFQELLSVQLDVWPRSVAYWRHAIYIGLEDGRLMRSEAVQ